MTPQREEAARLLRLARHDHAAFDALIVAAGVPAVEYRYDDDAPELLTGQQARAIIESVMGWAAGQAGLP